MYIKRLFTITIVTAIMMVFCMPLKAHEMLKYHDVDSIGDVWILVVDASGTMRDKSPKQKWGIQELYLFMLNKMEQKHIFDRFNYKRDRFFLYYSGIYRGEIDKQRLFLRNELKKEGSFTSLFIHPFVENGQYRDVLYLVYDLNNMMLECDYSYKFSCVSQMRTCALDSAIKYLNETYRSSVFNKIHIVTITDDSDINDQWRGEYKEMMLNAPHRVEEINRLNRFYINNPLSQEGGGILTEELTTFDPYNRKVYEPKIWLHSYMTLQQQSEKVNLQGHLLEIAPMDGEEIGVRLTSKVFRGDTIIFAYIDSICVNGEAIQVQRYTNDTLRVVGPYHNRFNRNDVAVYGKIQVEYEDSIYGMHMRKIDFEMHDSVITVQMASRRHWAIIIAIVIVLLVLLFVLVLLPNRYVFTLYTSDGEKVRVRRGYKRQWNEGINPLLHSSVDPKSRMAHTVTAKHACFSKSVCPNATGASIPWVILSRRPLAHSAQMEMMDTSMNIGRYIQRHDDCPVVLKQLYQSWGIKQVDKLADHRWKWVRSVGRSLQRLYHCVCPHYAYWMVNANMGDSLIVTSPLLPASPFLLEVLMEHHTTANDRILNSYYRNPSTPKAEVLIASTVTDEEMTWNVYHLSANLRLGHGIGDVRHMAHYIHPLVTDAERDRFAQRLRKAIQREMKISSIYIYHMPQEELVESRVVFQVEENACLYYLYLVDDTEKRKAQMIYSPFSDNMNANMPRKMVLIKQNRYDKELYSSLLPFESAKNMPGHGACMRESAVKFPAGGSLQGELSIEKKTIKFLNVTINTH